jgi:release factor glutamine methyltransferase
MTIEVANRLLLSSLSDLYDEREAASISSMVLEHLTGLPKSIRLLQKQTCPWEVIPLLYQELLIHRPVQYVLNEAWFDPIPFM